MKILILSDLHCGHHGGLWSGNPIASWFESEIKKIGKMDYVICNGDLIDGRGEKSGSLEQIALDRFDQCNIAVYYLEKIKSRRYLFTYGTPYHTGNLESWERYIAEKVGGEIADELRLEIDGQVFHVRHHTQSSVLPHGRATPLIREAMWDRLNGRQADWYIRSHVHYFQYIQNQFGRLITTPCFQTYSSFGTKRCVGHVDYGFIVINTKTKTVEPYLYDIGK